MRKHFDKDPPSFLVIVFLKIHCCEEIMEIPDACVNAVPRVHRRNKFPKWKLYSFQKHHKKLNYSSYFTFTNL